jgi:Na+-transporting NADH:ubiquinone oxidoreductase subunit NqrB
MFFKDVRDYQILFLSVFLALGICTRDWTCRWDLILVAIVSCILTQLFCFFLSKSQNRHSKPLFNDSNKFFDNPQVVESIYSLKSALITGLGLCLLLRANNYSTMALAGCLAIASKFLFRFQNKHFFNPSNFGIIAALIISKDAWVSPGQWGTDLWYLLLFLGAGTLVLKLVGRWETSAVFLLTYAGLEAIRNWYLGFTWDVWQHQLSSGSLLLFALFMVTDPRSIPNAKISRLIYAIAIALLTFILRDYFYISTAMLWALFIISPLTIWLDSTWREAKFSWQSLDIISRNNRKLSLPSA